MKRIVTLFITMNSNLRFYSSNIDSNNNSSINKDLDINLYKFKIISKLILKDSLSEDELKYLKSLEKTDLINFIWKKKLLEFIILDEKFDNLMDSHSIIDKFKERMDQQLINQNKELK